MDNVNNIYYVCSKRVKFLKRQVLDIVIEFFEKKDERNLHIDDIYVYLQKGLNISSVNKHNLKIFLKANPAGYVSFNDVQDISRLYPNLKKQEETSVYFSLSYLKQLKETLEVLGIENTIALLKTNGSIIYNVCELLQFLPATSFSYNIFSDLQHNFARFLESFSESDLFLLMDDEKMFNDFYQIFTEENKKRKKIDDYIANIRDLISNIHNDNKTMRLSYMLHNEANKLLVSMNILRVADLVNLTDENIVEMYNSSYAQTYILILDKLKYSLSEALRKDFFDVLIFKTKSGKPIQEWKKYIEIITKRVNGETLSNAGEDFGLTRERVRQIEKRYFTAFNSFYSNTHGSISRIIHAFANSKHYITVKELTEVFGEHTDIFIYYLKQVENDDMDYIPELDIFAYQDILNWYEELVKMSNDLPESISIAQIEKITQDTMAMFAELDIELPYEYVKTILVADYKLNGKIYSRSRMPLTKKYDIVLRKYFPEGIYIYEKEDMNKFRECYAKVFDDADKLPENDRALYGRISAITILCDRGKYISRPKRLISDELLKDICDYIDNSEKEIFITNTIFSIFEDKLKAECINNKYHLQGVLHASVPNKYFFKRDYVSKSRDITSMYTEITKYISQSDGPVTKTQIREEFPGVTDIVISIAVQDENIISGFSVYMSKNFIANQSDNVETLKSVISEMVEDGEIHKSDDLMSILSLMYPQIIEKFEIESRYTLFSIIEALFKDDFSLSRPFFALKGVEIGKQEERMRDYLEGKDEVDIDEFMEFVRDNSFIVYSILNQLNAFNDTFLLKDKNTIINIDSTGLNKYKAEYVEEYIDEIIQGKEVLVLNNLNYSLLPKINIQWNDWLVYSVINKWSDKYKVMMSSSQFRYSVPIIYRLEETPKDLEELLGIIKNKHGFDETQMAIYMRERNLVF